MEEIPLELDLTRGVSYCDKALFIDSTSEKMVQYQLIVDSSVPCIYTISELVVAELSGSSVVTVTTYLWLAAIIVTMFLYQ